MYARNILTLMTGGTMAMAIPILGAPILGRLYTPTDYAGIAAYLALVNIGSVVATLQFQHGIIAAATQRGALQVLKLTLTVVFTICVLLVPVLLLLRSSHLALLSDWLLFLPFSLFCVAGSLAITMYANRHKAFRALALIPVAAAFTNTSLAILLGVVQQSQTGSSGLFTALVCSHAITLAGSLVVLRHLPGNHLRYRSAELRVAMQQNRDFLRFSLPAILINTISMELLTIVLTLAQASALLGAYNRTKQLVSAPINVITTSINKAYYQHGAEDFRRTGNCRPLVLKTAAGLALAGLLPFGILLFWGPEIFIFVLGPDWGGAGHIAQILAPIFWLRSSVVPFIPTYQFTGNQKRLATLSAIYLGMMVATLGVTALFRLDPICFVYSFSATYVVIYLIQFFSILRLSRRHPQPEPVPDD